MQLQQQLHFTGISGKYLQYKNNSFEPATCWCAGSVFLQDRLLNLPELSQCLTSAITEQTLPELLKQLNGFFSIVLHYRQNYWLISDRLRSRPLFYRYQDRAWQISDNAYVLLKDSDSVDPLSAEEFLHCGYVTGAATLIQHIAQVEAAQYLCLSEASPEPDQGCYDLFWPENPDTSVFSHQEYCEKLDVALTAAIKRLIQVANGRTILVPLSGGYDSRALALYLKKSGYAKVECFTFGKADSFEVKTACSVAAALNFKLHRVTYQVSDWLQLKHCTTFARYKQQIHNLVSVPNIQVYPALQKLLAQGIITPDTIVVPGHTGDFVSGGHIPRLKQRSTCSDVTNAIWQRHYDLNRKPPSVALQAKLLQQVSGLWQPDAGANSAISCAEAWNYRERQTKFIVNSNRYYDFWQLDWWMPLWDWQFVKVWQQVPLSLRRNKGLWIDFVNQQYAELTGKQLVTAVTVIPPLVEVMGRRYLQYFFDHNHMYRLLPLSWWLKARLKLTMTAPSVFSYLAERTLQQLTRINNSDK